jgi:hypothetical protein
MSLEEKIQQRSKNVTTLLHYSRPIVNKGQYTSNDNNNSNSNSNIVNIHIENKTNESNATNSSTYSTSNNSISMKTKTTEICFSEDTDSQEFNNIIITPLDVVNNPNNHKIYYKFNFYVNKYGKDKMDNYLNIIDKERTNTKGIYEGIKNLFGEDDIALNKQLLLLAKLIVQLCKK